MGSLTSAPAGMWPHTAPQVRMHRCEQCLVAAPAGGALSRHLIT